MPSDTCFTLQVPTIRIALRNLRRLIFACVACGVLVACGERVVGLYSGLSEAEANRLVSYLDAQGVKTHKLAEREGTTVTVASSQLARASRLATQAGLPRAAYKGFGAVFPKDGLISSPLEERARLTYAVSQELEAMLVDMDGVLGARVNVVIPDRRNGRNTELPAAAVLIRHRSDMETDLLEMKVRRLVASSVPGLVEGDPRQISVSFMAVSVAGDAARMAVPAPVFPVASSSLPNSASALPSSSHTRTTAADPTPNDIERTLILLSMGLGAVAAFALVAWALREPLASLFRGKRRRVAPAA